MERIGFIGLGIMGKPMAMHLLKAGYSLGVLESSSNAGTLISAGATVYHSPAKLAAASDVVITMLPDSPEVEMIMFGPDGILAGLAHGGLYIDMSTIAPATALKLYEATAQKGIAALDAPVSGGQAGAEAAALSIMVGGDDDAFSRALPLFERMGKNIVHIGKAGAGQTTKACNQIVVGLTIQAVAEALTLAKKSGVNVAKVRSALLGGLAQSKILDVHGQRIIDQNFKPGFKMKLHRKDMNIALQTGRALSVPLPGSAIVASLMDGSLAIGDSELDHSALAKFLESVSGL
jgi:2-hydroxy-3-oxopropionate reductase